MLLPSSRPGPLRAVLRRVAVVLLLLCAVIAAVYLDRGGYRDSTGRPLSLLDCVYYATVTVMLENAASQMGRTFSVPLLVGETQASQKPTAPPATDATGQPVESMQAEER